jgi:hypothetical protein
MAEEFYLWPSICMYELSTIIIPLLLARRQSIASSTQELPDTAFKSVSIARHRQGRCVRRHDQVIDQLEVSR